MRGLLVIATIIALSQCVTLHTMDNKTIHGWNSVLPDASAVITGFAPHPSNPSWFFVVQQKGDILLYENQTLISTFLDITGRITYSGEQGLLGFTFHPNFAQNGFFFVHFDRLISGTGNSVIARYSVINSTHANASTEVVLVTAPYVKFNHKGGSIQFGPDGFLYFGIGEGGVPENAQPLTTLLGKISRIDPTVVPFDQINANTSAYAIPASNPYFSVNSTTIRKEIWTSGLRNPYRFWISPQGAIYVGDVGQDLYEELDIVTVGGANLGWPIMEGKHCYQATSCNETGLQLPVWEYPHTGSSQPNGVCIIGGMTYTGSEFPSLGGQYIVGDLVGNLWFLGISQVNDSYTVTNFTTLVEQTWNAISITSFGYDSNGDLLVGSTSGVYRLCTQLPCEVDLEAPEPPSSASSFPSWAIGLIILGVVLICIVICCVFLILSERRRR